MTGEDSQPQPLVSSSVCVYVHEHPYAHMPVYTHTCMHIMHTYTLKRRRKRRIGKQLLLGLPITEETSFPRLLGHAFQRRTSTMEHEPQNGQEAGELLSERGSGSPGAGISEVRLAHMG